MTPTAGFALVLMAGLLQGSFVLPMTLTRGWKWEHTWLAFSLLGMLVFNWSIGSLVVPHLLLAIVRTPPRDIYALLFFGASWGLGAILFGLGMERLGMAVGYPIIMGLILSLGALIPLAESGAESLISTQGLLMLIGTVVVLIGITMCSRASAGRTTGDRPDGATARLGLAIAVLAGILSCLPNVGLNNAQQLTRSARELGATPAMAANAAWVVQFTAGFVVNAAYCLYRLLQRRGAHMFYVEIWRNAALAAAMAILWIGSFYLYGIGASRMGSWGTILGWPLFISISILTGSLWGLQRGEWSGASRTARRQLNLGMIAVLVAAMCFGVGSAVR